MTLFSLHGDLPEVVPEDVQVCLKVNHVVRNGLWMGDLVLSSASLEYRDASELSTEMMKKAQQLRHGDILLDPHPSPVDVVRMAHVQLLLSSNLVPVEIERAVKPGSVYG